MVMKRKIIYFFGNFSFQKNVGKSVYIMQIYFKFKIMFDIFTSRQ